MLFLREIIRTVVLSPWVVMMVGAVIVMHVLPSGEWLLSSEEKAGIERGVHLSRTLAAFSRESVSTEIGAAQTYARGCQFELDYGTLASTMMSFGLEPDAFEAGKPMRPYWTQGVQRIASLLALSEGDSGRLAITCALGIAAFGDDGTLIPTLIRH